MHLLFCINTEYKMTFNFDNTYIHLSQKLYSKVAPTKVKAPQLVLYNAALAEQLGIDAGGRGETEIAEILSGNKLPTDAASIAQAYSGHQFGHFTTLGDGRAILLGEHLTPEGVRYDLQYKGSGVTPYSRRGDGRATLSSMLREYIFSEALHALRIPTTRSLAVVSTGEAVYREEVQAGGILTRVASSHIRVGTFQHARQFTSHKSQQQLTAYTINRHFPSLAKSEMPALDLLKAVMQRQISLIVNWMRVGFIHGVMNTDNMLLSGESIDFGPCAFMNTYKSNTVFSSIDHQGRYAFDKQASIALWNLTRLAESLLPQIDEIQTKAIEKVKEVLAQFEGDFIQQYQHMLLNKIGINSSTAGALKLMSRLTAWMTKHKADYTNTFVQLMYPELKLNSCFETEEVKNWINDWEMQLAFDPDLNVSGLDLMKENNPIYIPRTDTVENVLNLFVEEKQSEAFNDFMSIIKAPYASDNFIRTYMKVPNAEFDINYQTFCGT